MTQALSSTRGSLHLCISASLGINAGKWSKGSEKKKNRTESGVNEVRKPQSDLLISQNDKIVLHIPVLCIDSYKNSLRIVGLIGIYCVELHRFIGEKI